MDVSGMCTQTANKDARYGVSTTAATDRSAEVPGGGRRLERPAREGRNDPERALRLEQIRELVCRFGLVSARRIARVIRVSEREAEALLAASGLGKETICRQRGAK